MNIKAWQFCLIALFALMFTTAKAQDQKLGDENAPVTLVEYASLTCPHCASFHKNTVEKLTPYIDAGKLLYIYRDFPLDGTALGASMLAECVAAKSNSENYFKFLKLLYKEQSKWLASQDIRQALFKLSALAGLNDEQSNQCLENKDIYDAVIADRKQGEADGVNATPSVFINGKKLEDTSYKSVKNRIEALAK